MFPSTTTHVRQQLDEKLKILLDSSYIINVLLKEFEPYVVESFINKYVATYDDKGTRTKDGNPIKVITNYPQELPDGGVTIFVGMGDGKQSNSSIGQVEGEFTHDNGDPVREIVHFDSFDNDSFTLKLSNEVVQGSVTFRNMTIDDNLISYSDTDHTKVIIRLALEERQALNLSSDTEFDISYIPLESERRLVGQSLGFTSQEVVQVVIMSANMDTLRIVDALVKASFILMRSDDEEQSGGYSLGTLEYGAIAPVEGIDTTPNIIFGREIDVTYTVSYGMQNKNLQEIKKILMKLNNEATITEPHTSH